jgi:hypothetical protein
VAFLSLNTFTIKQNARSKRQKKRKKKKERNEKENQWNAAVRAAPLYAIKND